MCLNITYAHSHCCCFCGAADDDAATAVDII